MSEPTQEQLAAARACISERVVGLSEETQCTVVDWDETAKNIAEALAERERRVWAAIKGMAERGGFGMDNYGVIYRSAHPHRTSAEALCAILNAAWEATKPGVLPPEQEKP